ncbi:hypothetical protein NLM24_10125 [Nocardia zapadnayensis]|uniref:hypothetical protein n=1 Tax=Nocardia rhamnosiphila TaxID=426716 RepID=UPI0022469042|nr:hypothetical protein [Nocardia zapadnayensis]MCX0271055.1 hypothetical protein [Nocardia zapadnayensis]
MPTAIVYLNKSLCGTKQEHLEAECRDFVRAHGFAVARVVLESGVDVLPWTLRKSKLLGGGVIVTPTVEHIGFRAPVVLERCGLMVVHPYGWYRHGDVDPWIPATPEVYR